MRNQHPHSAESQPFGERLLSVQQAADRTGLTHWCWRRWCATGRVHSVKLGAALRVPESEVTRIIEEGTRPRRAQQPKSWATTPDAAERAFLMPRPGATE